MRVRLAITVTIRSSIDTMMKQRNAGYRQAVVEGALLNGLYDNAHRLSSRGQDFMAKSGRGGQANGTTLARLAHNCRTQPELSSCSEGPFNCSRVR